jgi:cytochrome b pre-mRNA-processing protein 3
MFYDMDLALGQMGVGDMSMGKHIRRMQRAFNGRVHAYEAALGNRTAMMDALRRNVYGTIRGEIAPDILERFADRFDAIIARESKDMKGQQAS